MTKLITSTGWPDPFNAVGIASAITQAVGSPVLQFAYAEDHGWSFAVAKPNQQACVFVCEWDQEPPATKDLIDRSALEGIVGLEIIEKFLVAADRAADGTPLAYRFADALGLPAYRWLSPDYIERDTQHFIQAGARKLGRKPARPRETSVPPSTKLDLRNNDVSAREALALLESMMNWCRPPWALRSLSGSSEQGWDFRFYNPNLRETIRGCLFPNGNAGFRSQGREPEPISEEEMERRLTAWRADPKYADFVKQIEADLSAPPVPIALPAEWLDSNAALAIAETIKHPEELGEISSYRFLSLRCSPNPAAYWEISHMSTNSDNRVRWTIELDAQTGMLLREVLSKPGEGRNSWIISPWRERITGGHWKDL